MPRPFLIALGIIIAIAGSAGAQTREREGLVVRSYNAFGVASNTMRSAERGLLTTFAGAGIDVHWRECRTSRRTSLARCDEVLMPREVVVRIVQAPRTARDPNVLGFSYVDTRVKRGTLGTVYMDRVTALARQHRVEPGRMLGQAIAHEVAHLLLGTTAHASSGLMREQLLVGGLFGRLVGRTRDADWTFSDSEAAAMRAALAPLSYAPVDLVVSARPITSEASPAKER